MLTNLVDDGLTFPNALTRRTSTNYIVVHHTASGLDTTVHDIAQGHLKNGWNGIGYHFVIYPDGSVHQGRPIWASGAHCENHNWESVGVNLVGYFEPTDDKEILDALPQGYEFKPTDEQMTSLKTLIADLKFAYPGASVVGHRDLNQTACPGQNLYSRLGEVA